MTNAKQFRFHYAWVILAACCLFSGATLGIIINCKGLFIAPVCAELGCSVSSFTLYMTFYGVASALMLLKVSHVFERYPIRRVLTLALTAFCGSTALMGSSSGLLGFYILGIIQGISGAFLLFVLTPMLIKNWFIKRRGFALGLSGTFSGVFGVVMNPMINEIIQTHGWRYGYYSQGLLTFALVVPLTLFVIVKKPEDMGLAPYGAESSAPRKKISDREQRYFSKEFLYTVIFVGIMAYGTTYIQQLSNHAVSIGLNSQVGAMMASCAMIGTMGGKTVLGIVADRWGGFKACALASIAPIIGFAVLALSTLELGCYTGSFLIGVNNTNHSVIVPLMVAGIVPEGAFERAHSRVTMIFMLLVAFGPVLIGASFDILGSYQMSFAAACLLQTIAMILALKVFAAIMKGGIGK